MKTRHNLSGGFAAAAALLSYWRKAPGQLFALIFGLALATALWSAVQAINSEARASYDRADGHLSSTGFATLTHRDRPLALSDYITLRRAGWAVSPVREATVALGAEEFPIVLVDSISHPLMSKTTNLANKSEGAEIGVRSLRLAHPSLKNDIQGDVLKGSFTYSDIVPPGLIVADFGHADDLGVPSVPFSYLILLPKQLSDLTPLVQLIPGIITHSAGAGLETGELTQSFHLNLTAFGLLSFVVGLFIVHSTINLALEQRRGLIRTLRCLGVPFPKLIVLLAAELLLFAVCGALLGVLIGYGIAGLLMPGVSATLQGLYGADIEGSLSLRKNWILSGFSMAILGSLLAGARGLFVVAQLPILQGPAQRARGQTVGRIRATGALIGSILLGCAAIILLLSDSLISGFLFLGSMMLGAALLLPVILSWILGRVARRAVPGLSQWLWADLRSQLPMLATPLMALMLAISTNIGVETMTYSFRLTLVDWLEHRFAADLYLRLRADDDPEQISAWLHDHGATALPLVTTVIAHQGHEISLYGVIDHPHYASTWPLRSAEPDPWQKLHAGSGVLINEQMAYGLNLWPGANLTHAQAGELRITGVYPDYGNPGFQMVTSAAQVRKLLPDYAVPSLTILLGSPSKTPILRGLSEEFDVNSTAILDQPALRARSLAIFDQTFVITAALNVLTLAVAGFALLTSFLAMWGQRLPQLAPVWAMGVPPRTLARYELFRSLALTVLTAVLALPLGLALAWTLLNLINVQAFGWRLPMYLFPLSWLKIFSLSLGAALLAAAIPALRLRRISPATLLKVFASER